MASSSSSSSSVKKELFTPFEVYKQSAWAISNILERKSSIRSACYADDIRNKKAVFALVTETLKFKSILEEILTSVDFFSRNRKLPKPLVMVMAYDMLLGRGLKLNKNNVAEILHSEKTRLHSYLVKMKIKAGARDNIELLPANLRNDIQLPRYVRVNTIVCSVDDAVKQFQAAGFELCENMDAVLTRSEATKSNFFFCHDSVIPALLIFPPRTDMHDVPIVKQHKVILQDKASCLPAFVLSPPPNATAIDGCAAPGNKTSHLAAIMQNKGKVFAFDKSRHRAELLRSRMYQAKASIVEARNASFLDTDPLDPQFASVEYILLDPSCSGSGIVSRFDFNADEEESEIPEDERLKALADFQLAAILHAFKFPNVRRVSYSTCSIHVEENELVVEDALRQQQSRKDGSRFACEPILPEVWTSRGLDTYPNGPACIRAYPEKDKTIGFFVALFVREGRSSKAAASSQPQKQDSNRKRKMEQTQPQPQQNAGPSKQEIIPQQKQSKKMEEKAPKVEKKEKQAQQQPKPAQVQQKSEKLDRIEKQEQPAVQEEAEQPSKRQKGEKQVEESRAKNLVSLPQGKASASASSSISVPPKKVKSKSKKPIIVLAKPTKE